PLSQNPVALWGGLRDGRPRQKHPAWRPASFIGGVINPLKGLAALLCAARSSSRLASCLSSQSCASAAALCQVGCCPPSRGNGALRSMVAIDRNSRKFFACAEKRPALRAFSNVPYVRS